MDGKPKISPTHTYVFDEGDLEQLDELSLSSVMKAVDMPLLDDDMDLGADDYVETTSFELTDFDDTHLNLDDLAATAADDEQSVDDLLAASDSVAETDEDVSAENPSDDSGSYEELLSPEVLLRGSGSGG